MVEEKVAVIWKTRVNKLHKSLKFKMNIEQSIDKDFPMHCIASRFCYKKIWHLTT